MLAYTNMITSKRLYYIDSHNRLSGTHSNFSYQIEIPKTESFDKVVVLACSIPKSYYLVVSGRNTMTLSELGTSVTVTIPPGNYGVTSFRAAAATALTTASPNVWTYTVTYPAITASNTGKLTYVSSTGNPSLIFGEYLWEQFGFNANSTNLFVGSTITSANVVKMQVKDTLQLHSNICTNGQDDILQEIFSSAPDFSAIKFESPDVNAYSKALSTQSFNVYQFTLTDEDGTLIDLNGLNVVITLCVYRRDPLSEIVKSYLRLMLMKQPKEKTSHLIDT